MLKSGILLRIISKLVRLSNADKLIESKLLVVAVYIYHDNIHPEAILGNNRKEHKYGFSINISPSKGWHSSKTHLR